MLEEEEEAIAEQPALKQSKRALQESFLEAQERIELKLKELDEKLDSGVSGLSPSSKGGLDSPPNLENLEKLNRLLQTVESTCKRLNAPSSSQKGGGVFFNWKMLLLAFGVGMLPAALAFLKPTFFLSERDARALKAGHALELMWASKKAPNTLKGKI
jgi:hypothetical protein